jgi:hypothetical protein
MYGIHALLRAVASWQTFVHALYNLKSKHMELYLCPKHYSNGMTDFERDSTEAVDVSF